MDILQLLHPGIQLMMEVLAVHCCDGVLGVAAREEVLHLLQVLSEVKCSRDKIPSEETAG